MKTYHVFNYHVTNCCNYHCTYCFGKFEKQPDPSFSDAKLVIDNICHYFKENGVKDGRINFAGGEPMFYPHLDELIAYTKECGALVSIITNGSMLTAERIRFWQGKVSCIGISIDSLHANINKEIGRCCGDQVKNLSDWRDLAKVIHECDIEMKVNTVVSKLNIDENLSSLYHALWPQKIKFFQMHLVKGINDRAKPFEITVEKFEAFLVPVTKNSGLSLSRNLSAVWKIPTS